MLKFISRYTRTTKKINQYLHSVMQKYSVFTVIFSLTVLLSFSARAQDFEDRLVSKQFSCADISLKSSELFPYYLDAGLIDSATILLDNWHGKCGFSEPVFRANLLMVLKMFYYDEKSLPADLLQKMDIYYVRNNLISNNQQYSYNYHQESFDYVPVGGVFDTWTKNLASELLTVYAPGTAEYLLSLFYSGKTDSTYYLLQQQPNIYTLPGRLYDTLVQEYKNLPSLSLSGFAGAWVPNGQLSKMGVHPEIGMTYGLKNKADLFEMVIAFKFINTPNEYYARRVKNAEPEVTNHFFGGYIGFEYSRDLLMIPRHNLFFGPIC